VSIFDRIALAEAAGLHTDRMTAEQLYEINGKLIADTILTRAALQFLENGNLKTGSRVKALRVMSQGAKTELRKRIGMV